MTSIGYCVPLITILGWVEFLKLSFPDAATKIKANKKGRKKRRSLNGWCLSVCEKKGCSKRHVLVERGSPPTPPIDVVAVQWDRLRARGDSLAGRLTIGAPNRVSRRGVAFCSPCALHCAVYLRPRAVLPPPLPSFAGFSPFNGNGHRFIGFFSSLYRQD